MPKRILIVDDELAAGEALERSLNYLGFETYYCCNGNQALLHIQGGGYNMPQLIITDMKMPKMNGLELTKISKIKSPNLPVIIMTGQPDLIPKENPADQIIKKPVDFYFLLETVNKLI